MIKYYATFLGNDTFQTTYPVEAANFAGAVAETTKMLESVQGHTIELVRIGSIEEVEAFALDRLMVK